MTSKKISRKSKKKPVAAKKPAPTKKPAPKPGPRADFGEAIDPFFAKQPPQLRAVLEELRQLVKEAAPEASGVCLSTRSTAR